MKRKTIRRRELSTIAMTTGNEKRISKVILDGTVRNWVGFGWVDEGKPTAVQKRTLPTVIN